MDLSEALRAEDLAKTDFFDLVVGSELSSAESHLQLTRTLKSMGLCLVDGPESSLTSESTTALLPVDSIKQEANNNTLLLPSANINNESNEANESIDSYWQNTCDKEAVRIETAILEDLNKYCWNGEGELGAGVPLRPLNTDGAIYTLTVLNGGESFSNENTGNTSNGTGNESGTTSGVTSAIESQTPLVDLDSILSIIPGGQSATLSASTALHVSTGSTTYIAETPFETVILPESKNEYFYEDSGYGGLEANNQDGGTTTSAGSYVSTPDNNNDWKQADHNATTLSNVTDSADSLLRNALQGKAAFSSQQNRYKREATESMDEILFPTMDAAFPDEYEKLKRIATEVAESVNQFCRDSPNLPISSSPGVTLFTSLTPATPTSVPTTVVITSANASAASGISSPARPNKKFKKSSSCIKGSSNSNCTTSLNNGNITPSAGSSSTNSNTTFLNTINKQKRIGNFRINSNT